MTDTLTQPDTDLTTQLYGPAPVTGPQAALDAANALADTGAHVHLVGSGQSDCLSQLTPCPEPAIGGLSISAPKATRRSRKRA